jgi:hypothetical protein
LKVRSPSRSIWLPWSAASRAAAMNACWMSGGIEFQVFLFKTWNCTAKIASTSVAYLSTSCMLKRNVQIGCTWMPSTTPFDSAL